MSESITPIFKRGDFLVLKGNEIQNLGGKLENNIKIVKANKIVNAYEISFWSINGDYEYRMFKPIYIINEHYKKSIKETLNNL